MRAERKAHPTDQMPSTKASGGEARSPTVKMVGLAPGKAAPGKATASVPTSGSPPSGKSPPGGADRGLDWLNLFVANIQTGFGPFIAVYLTTRGWTQTSIGVALSLGTVTAMASQIPAGAVVDAIRSKSLIAALSIIAFTASALMFAVLPTPLFVYLAEILHGFASCILGPAIAAMSLAIAGQAALGLRLGRNARFSSIGNGVAAALMGACGYYISSRAVFFLTAILTLPALAALIPLSHVDTRYIPTIKETSTGRRATTLQVLADRRLLVFATCAALFTLANAAMLPLVSTNLTKRAGNASSLLIAACIVLPQIIVALLSPTIGRLAESHGRRAVLLLGFVTLPLRGLLFAGITDPFVVVAIQMIDGIASASFGVMVPLVTSDIAGRSGHFNLSLGAVGFGIGIGATFSTTLAGWIADRFGDPIAFVGLAAVGLAATLLVWAAMPETRPET
ncbi:MAG TPA: MFS transporter [Stellaceae bacterium]|nr:MFS transporter [Stellaceae bacterium]